MNKFLSLIAWPVRRDFRQLLLLIILALAGCQAALAAPTSEQQASLAVQGWLRLDHQPLGARLAANVSRVASYRDAEDEVAYHVVFLAPSGMVIVAGDTLVEPIVGFFPETVSFDPSDKNPVGALVARDLPGRVSQVRQRQAEAARLGRTYAPSAEQTSAQTRWQRLEAAAASTREMGLASISDVRVAPLLQSTWDQDTVAGSACYNYYTPPYGAGSSSNYPCGCVATAASQLLRFYQYPAVGVGTGTFTIYVNGSPQTATLRGGNGSGGPYDWAGMPLSPTSSITTAQRQAIGALTYDAGISVNMDYASSGSGSDTLDTATSLKSVFKYGNAVKGYNSGSNIPAATVSVMVNPNLDAGWPVLFGITGSYGGHAIVCDGYGYSGSTLYHHLNLGWSGNSNAWYNLPTIDASIPFNTLYKIIYNVYPSGSGEIISGRVTTTGGTPISGVTVTAVRSGGGSYTATTNANGIYALGKVPSSSTYTVSAAKSGYSFASSQTVNTGLSQDFAASSGNAWGVNFTSTPTIPSLEVTPATPFSTSGNPGGPFSPASASFAVKNIGVGTLDWTAGKAQSWVTLSKAGGSLAAGATDTVTVSINAGANSLAIGGYGDTVTFTNTTNGDGNTTRGVGLTVNDPNTWTQATAAAPWAGRDGHAVEIFNNQLWISGGWGSSAMLNDVWHSADGVTWTAATGAAPWGIRYGHSLVNFNGKLWVLGGIGSSTTYSDVWSSSDGASWTQVTSAAPWGTRGLHTALVFGGKLWVLGGYNNGIYLNDVWSTPDGVNWTRETATAAWSAREKHASAVFGGKMWVMGGQSASLSYLNDVWSSVDGVNWTQVTGAAAWSARRRHVCSVMSGKLWVMGGLNSSSNLNDVWCSMDGVTWTASTVTVPWTTRMGLGSAVFQNRLFVLGGYDGLERSDVWYLPGAPLTGPVLELNPATNLSAIGGVGGPFSPSSATYTISNTGTTALAWTAAKTQSWVTLSKTGGSLAAGTSDTLTVSINSGANGLAIGNYSDMVTVTNSTNGQGNTTRGVGLNVTAPTLGVTPSTPLTTSGNPGGPFLPGSTTFTLTNTTIGTLAWTAGKTQSWLTLSKTGGSLAAGATDSVVVSINAGANTLGIGSYADTLSFTNTTNGLGSTTRGVSLTVNDPNTWQLATSAAPWGPRTMLSTVVFNNKLWVLGGYTSSDKNDVWSSSDGVSWTQVTAAAPWIAREDQEVVAFNGKLVLVGGASGGSEVWSSSDGANWTQLTGAAPWGPREEMGVVVLGGKLWVMGGYGSSYKNDVWSSSDGVSWTQVTAAAPWAARTDLRVEAFNGRIYVMGGSGSGGSYNDVWSSADGASWRQETAAAPWAARAELASAVVGGKLWVVGGVGSSYYADAWSTTDGANWSKSTAAVPWAARSDHSAAGFQNRLYVLGGEGSGYYGDVWYLPVVPPTGLYVTPGSELAAAGNPGGPFTPGSAVYTLTNLSTQTLAWTAGKTQSWVTLSKAGGSLAAGTSDTLTVTINAGASTLGIGSYADTVSFTNTTNGQGSTTRGVSLTVNDPNVWQLATSAAAWEARDGHATAVFNNKLWILGGWGAGRLNDVWSSSDGANWTQVTAAAPWGARNYHSVVVFNNKLYLLGGTNSSTNFSDVWSSADGVSWTQLTSAAPWGPRYAMSVQVFSNKLWVIGGYNGAARNDVWNSSDGITWTQVTSAAAWNARYCHSGGVLNGKMWIMGGYSGSSDYNDVWSSVDGVTWTQATASAAWSARRLMSSAVIGDKLWILGGIGSSSYLKEVWFSADGVNWSKSTVAVPWTARCAFAAEAFQDRLYILGGYGGSDYRDVWYLPVAPPTGLYVTPGSGLAAAGNPGGPFTPGSAVYTLTNLSTQTLAWTAGKTQSWVTLSKAGGSLAAGTSTTLTVSINAGANTLAIGSYNDAVTFTNTTTGKGNTTRDISLTVNDPNAWQLATSAAAWSNRMGHATVAFGGKLWVLGGYSSISSSSCNDVWSSTDGATWTQVTASAPWSTRYYHQAVVFNGKIYVIGGYGGSSVLGDIWSSSDGASWTQVTATAPWGNRYGMSALVFNGKLWMLGGYSSSGGSFRNDVWSSSDGVTWTQVTSAAAWPARGFQRAEAFGGKLWIMGGENTSYSYTNDVWSSSDGVTWTQATASAAWSPRGLMASAVADGKLWVLGGTYYNGSSTYYNDAWCTSDGATWTRSTVPVPWTGRCGLSAAVFQNRLYITGGSASGGYCHDVWYLPVAPLIGLEVDPDWGLAAAGNPGGPFTPASLTYTLSNTSTQTLAWTAGKTQSWVTLSKTGGSLAAGTSTTLTVSLNAGVNTLAIGSYGDTVTFTNTSTGKGSTTRGVGLTVNDPNAWQLATSAAPWSTRMSPGAVVFNNKLWVLGGYSGSYYRDVWSSADGVNWTQATASAPWSARYGHGVAVLGGKLYLLGGYGGSYDADVWSSSDGVNWTQLTSAAPWSGRYSPTVVAYNNQLWVLGGYVSGSYYNDVWSSSDGATWTRVTSAAPWPARYLARCEVFGGKMWIMGGNGSSNCLNDVWSSSDGVNWTQATASAAWSPRSAFASAVAEGKLWILGGFNGGSSGYFNEVWCSTDGVNWSKSTVAVPWAARNGLGGAVFQNRLYVLGGYSYNNYTYYHDVWYLPLTPPSGMTVTPDSGLSASGNPGGPFSPSSVSFTLTNITTQTLAWTAGKTQNWLTLSKTGGSLAAGATDSVVASINAGANTLAIGSYADTLSFTNSTTGQGNTTRPVNLTVNDPNTWQLATSAAPWGPRTMLSTVVFNNRLWVIGGYTSSDKNDVWSSGDGVSWTLVTAAAPWIAREDHEVVAFNGKLVLVGGASGGSEVWSSSDGASWTQLTGAAPWGPREEMGVVVLGGKLWVVGGAGSSYKNDVWSSSDGVSWTQVTAAAPWAARTDLRVEAFNGRIYVMGGSGSSSYNDVWSSADGASWRQETAAAPWAARAELASAVVGGKLWVVGGVGSSYYADAWSTTDGANWSKSTAAVPWAARSDHSAAGFQNRLYVLGGEGSGYYGDVWYLPVVPPTGLYVTPGSELAAAGSPGGPFTPDSLTYTLANLSTQTLAWTAGKTQSWVTLSKAGGSLAAGTSVTLTVMINAGASTLGIGSYADTVSFTNATNGQGSTTRGVGLTVNDPNVWQLATSAPAWSARSGQGTVVFNNKLWILGGDSGSYCHDVWSSGDGVNWGQVLSAAPWPARRNPGALAFNGKLYMLGGYGGSYYHDVWCSSDGANWTQLTAAAPWSGRAGMAALVFNNQLWVLGGYSDTTSYHDVWCSSDGASWTQVTSAAPWTARGLPRGEVFGGKMWIMGGNNNYTYYSDVWSSSDGANWTQATGAAGWTGRTNFSSTVAGGKLWILGGFNYTYGNFNDVWSSSDGATWSRSTVTVPWVKRCALAAATFLNRLYVLGGHDASYYHDVWYLPVAMPAGLSVTPATDFSATGRPGGPFAPASAVYTLKNTGTTAINWTVDKTASWLTLSRSGGTLAAGASDTLTVSLNTAANRLAAGTARDTVSFTNTTTGQGNATRAVSLTVFPAVDPGGWTQVQPAAAFPGRSAHACVVFGGKLWLIGGYDGSKELNDVWFTTDGATWTRATAAAPFAPRQHHTCLALNNRLWVMGGYLNSAVSGPTYLNDVWSSADGVTWTQVTAAAAFAKRMAHSGVVFGGKLWVIGGCAGSTYFGDAWSSADGAVWTRATALAFPERAHHASVVFNNRVWVIAGGTKNTNGEVWSSANGVTWTLNAREDAMTRDDHACAVLGGKIWLTAGSAPGPTREVWTTDDGLTWLMQGRAASFPARDDHASLVFGGKLWVIGGLGAGGQRLNDVWSYSLGSAAQPVAWASYE